MRRLIVNADDLGRSAGVNRGIVEAHERGVVTSASLMVRYPAAAEAAAYARPRPALSVGLHVDLGEWVYRDAEWHAVYSVPPEEAERELRRQLERFRELLGDEPTHLDSHQHVHDAEPLRSALDALGAELGVPVRGRGVRYLGEFYGQTAKGAPYAEAITVEFLLALLASLPGGVSELGCHPGYGDDLVSSYRDERAVEVATLCDPRVRAALEAEAIELVSFRDLRGESSSPTVTKR